MTKVVKHFESIAETKPIEIKLHGTDQATKLWRYWMTQEPADFNNLLGNGKRLNPFVELAKKLTFRSDFTMGAIYSLIDDVLPKENADKMKEITRKCDEELTVIQKKGKSDIRSNTNHFCICRTFWAMMGFYYITI